MYFSRNPLSVKAQLCNSKVFITPERTPEERIKHNELTVHEMRSKMPV